MKFLNSDGLRTVLSKIKDKFATKEQLQELEKKSSGGYEEVVVKLRNNKECFKFIKIGRRVDVFQVFESKGTIDTLPPKFRTSTPTYVGIIYPGEKSFDRDYGFMLFIDNELTIKTMSRYFCCDSNYNRQSMRIEKISNMLDEIYIGSYITKE